MQKVSFILLSILWLTNPLYAQFTQKNLEVKLKAQSKKEKETTGFITFQNLRIYPVFAKKEFEEINRDIGNFTPLEEALKSKKTCTQHLRFCKYQLQFADSTTTYQYAATNTQSQ